MDATALHALAAACSGVLLCGDGTTTVTTICKDTRTLQSGDLYWALVGDNFDGHDFVGAAAASGAAAGGAAHAASPTLAAPTPINFNIFLLLTDFFTIFEFIFVSPVYKTNFSDPAFWLQKLQLSSAKLM